MKLAQGILAGVMILAVAFGVVACGKKGPPEPPGPADQVTYPRVYPTR